jgi:MFS family permease
MSSFSPSSYLALFKIRQTLVFDIGALLMRMFPTMTVLAVVTTLTLSGWGFSIAGTVSTVLALVMFFVGPKISRKVDECGQSKIVPFAVIVAIFGLCIFIATLLLNLPWWLIYVAALFMGCTPNPQSMARTRWSYLIESGKLRQMLDEKGKTTQALPEVKTAFALEGILDDAAYMLGPSIAIALSATFFPTAGMFFAGIVLVLGTVIMLSSRETEPIVGWKSVEEIEAEGTAASNEACAVATGSKEEAAVTGSKAGATDAEAEKILADNRNMFFASSVVRAFFAIMFMVGIFYGAHDTVMIAVGEATGNAAFTSLILLVASAISIFGSIIFGSLNLKFGLDKQLLAITLCYSAFYGCMMFSDTLPVLAVVACISALFFGPTVIIINTVCEHCVPKSRLTESLTWVSAGYALGTALIPTIFGFVIDLLGAWTSVHIAGALAWTIFVIAFIVRPVVKKHQF